MTDRPVVAKLTESITPLGPAVGRASKNIYSVACSSCNAETELLDESAFDQWTNRGRNIIRNGIGVVR